MAPSYDGLDASLPAMSLASPPRGSILLPCRRIQKRLLLLIAAKETTWKVEVLQEQRLQLSATTFRVPDLLVLPADHVLDPASRLAFRCDATGFQAVTGPELTVAGTPIRLSLSSIFAPQR